MSETRILGSHAIVIGSGIAGLCAAQVLSGYFERVTVIEKGDPRPSPTEPRKEVPQGYHLHALLKGGEEALERLFPGITKVLIQEGSTWINGTQDLKWFHHGVWKKRFKGRLSVLLQSRPFLEGHIRCRVEEDPRISICYRTQAVRPLYHSSTSTITGIHVEELSSGLSKDLSADLVLDASGYGSKFHPWFISNGYHVPVEKVNIDLCYISQIYQLPPVEERDWSTLLVYPYAPVEKTGGTISCIEGNRHIVTLFGYHSPLAHANLKEAGEFLEFTKQLPQDTIYQELQGAIPLSEIRVHKVPHMTRYRWEKMSNPPQRFLFMGDSLCRFDPVFGQGMSAAAMQALQLKDCLQMEWEKRRSITTHFTKRYYKKMSKLIDPIWDMILIEDFRYPHVSGRKPRGLRFLQWYIRRVFRLSSEDTDIYNSFIYVMNLLRPATTLFSPSILCKVLGKWKRDPNM
ncbi:FAD-dependent oxidoreductase [Ammoniphilus resinae]|uniref:2-polyprenyl-6-methoxyphenol hydroxylase-like FAD-dependent oxidoreductase n=1 Tax=Ammoniphilus resinae TaxID=861532 RepID=A0ABS4GSQ7_9BACL|nr:NAD(P)-binding protein [Ammoniphilus resinae]MBP1933315.1 2-polyprenyl-6-methoxyphenol hydroxylase-like FAD-dependent oxidoreductase [Ammoniphilus resinae]